MCVVEVGGDGDDGFGDGAVERGFGILSQLAEDEGGDLRRGQGLLAELHRNNRAGAFGDAEREEFEFVLHVSDAAAHQALHGVDGAVGVIDEFLAGGVAYDVVAGSRIRNDARNEFVAVFAGDDFGLRQVHPRDEAVSGAEVYPDYAVVVVKLDLEHVSGL